MTLDFPVRTASLLLRPYQEADFEDHACMAGDAEITRYLPWGPRDRGAAREAFDKRMANGRMPAGFQHLPLAMTTHDGAFVGEISLINIDRAQRRGEIGYVLMPEFYGRGLATEAGRAILRIGFETLGLHRIAGACDDRNLSSARVMEKLGMRREAHHLSDIFYHGEWASSFGYAMLEDEWQAASA